MELNASNADECEIAGRPSFNFTDDVRRQTQGWNQGISCDVHFVSLGLLVNVAMMRHETMNVEYL